MIPLEKNTGGIFFLAFYQETYYNLLCIKVYENESLFIQIWFV